MKKRYLFLLLLLLALIALPLMANAETKSGACGDNLTWTLTDAGTLTISGTGPMSDFSSYFSSWHPFRESVKQVTIKQGVTSIGKSAFEYCANLKKATIPAGVTSIGDFAFMSCSQLEKVNIPDSVTSIGWRSFYDCASLKSITLHDGITSIHTEAFDSSMRKYSKIGSQTAINLGKAGFRFMIPGSDVLLQYTGIGFSKEMKYLEAVSVPKDAVSVTIPDGVTRITSPYLGPFDRPYLKNITIPKSVTYISASVFSPAVRFFVKKDSYAHKFALDHGYPVSLIGEKVPAEATGTTVQEKVKQIVKEVVRSGMTDYQKAIALHNYLGSHAVYDYTFTYYGADGVLLQGKGVCDSYSKAYALLLDEVGIENSRVSSSTHAWNVAKLDGAWCHIDVTWDDTMADAWDDTMPGAGDQMFWGLFGLTDFAMKGVADHAFDGESNLCTDYKNSAEYREGYLDWIVNNWKDTINEHLDAGEYSFTITGGLEGFYGIRTRLAFQVLKDETFMNGGKKEKPRLSYQNDIDGISGTFTMEVAFTPVKPVIKTQPSGGTVYDGKTAEFKVVATGAASYQWQYRKSADDSWKNIKDAVSDTLSFTARETDSGRQYRCKVSNTSGSVYSSVVTLTVKKTNALTLPAKMKVIEEEAFAGDTSITEVVIPDGVTSIGARAFSGCTGLQTVTLPASVKTIGEGAFDRCGSGLTFRCPAGSAAETYAKANGINVQ